MEATLANALRAIKRADYSAEGLRTIHRCFARAHARAPPETGDLEARLDTLGALVTEMRDAKKNSRLKTEEACQELIEELRLALRRHARSWNHVPTTRP